MTDHQHTDPTFDDHKADDHTAKEEMTPERLGEMAIKFATETAYAAAGLANVVAAKAKELYETQKAQLAEKTPEGVDPNFKQFVDTMPDQLKTLMDEAVKGFKDLSDKGRHVVENISAQAATAAEKVNEKVKEQADKVKEKAEEVKEKAAEAPGAFDTQADVDAPDDAETVAPEDYVDDVNRDQQDRKDWTE